MHRTWLCVGLLAVSGLCGCKRGEDTSGRTGTESEPRTSLHGYPAPLDAATRACVREDIKVEVRSAVAIEDKTLAVFVLVRNRVKFRTLEFKSWEGKAATLVDDKGNMYDHGPAQAKWEQRVRTPKDPDPDVVFRLPRRAGEEFVQQGSGPMEFDESRQDFLAFGGPLESVEYVDLELHGDNAGTKDPIRFRIPRSMWQKGKD